VKEIIVMNTSGERLRSNAPRLNFEEMGIPAGSILQFVDSNITVTVAGIRTVKLDGQEMFLTQATKQVLGLPIKYQIRPTRRWTYLGRPLLEIYNETYKQTE
jgi:hypothetical protein